LPLTDVRAFQTVLLDLGAKLRLPGNTCVGCHACATSCKEWNTGGYPAPLSDQDLCSGSHLSKAAEPRCHAANFVMREMGYRVAREHAVKLRRITVAPCSSYL
jgi:hypothetical protein